MLLDGKKVSDEKCVILKKQIKNLTFKPALAVIQVGNDLASDVYVRQKRNFALKLDIKFEHYKLNENISENEIISIIKKLNMRKDINGIVLQLPLPKSFDENKLLNLIDSDKDVDGLTDINNGRLWKDSDGLIPCTAKGIISLLNYYDISLLGKRVAIVGRSILVGKPLAALFLNEDATVTICHSKTKNLKSILLESDIIIVAVGKANFITEDMIKEGTIIVDAGINITENGLVGDVHFEDVKDKALYITPVPGGVGPMTVYSLMENVIEVCKKIN
ncbi:MAG: bifunctional 5,10-methylenetetrahydrofolate dehydrogenase/5,10-methenyltetrahydrofolate cyclohydrolase [Bacilli bacterium]|nr:bifunctional 5,10-methylenetetrahydrofolate dehydrogenase/5,10-methenyltetrahydrofolate cyclohydrolase [Bacilli bacterium]